MGTQMWDISNRWTRIMYNKCPKILYTKLSDKMANNADLKEQFAQGLPFHQVF